MGAITGLGSGGAAGSKPKREFEERRERWVWVPLLSSHPQSLEKRGQGRYVGVLGGVSIGGIGRESKRE